MARRPSSARSSARGSRASSRSDSTRSSGGRAGAGRAGAGRAGARDGKVDIYCPQCAAHFRIPEEGLDNKVTCTECTRTFFAKTAVGKRPRQKDNSKTYLAFGIAAVVIVLGLFLLSRGGGEQRREPTPPRVDKMAELDKAKKRRTDHIMKWATFAGRDEIHGMREYSDMPKLAASIGVTAKPGDADFDQAFLAAMKTHDAARLLREMVAGSADISDSTIENKGGEATLYFRAKVGDTVYDKAAGASAILEWTYEADTVKISSIRIGKAPVIRGDRPGDASTGKTYIPSDEVEAPKVKDINLGGENVKVFESPPAPISHLKETQPDQQKEVDDLIARLLAAADSDMPAEAGKVRNALENMSLPDRIDRNPAIPRLLNALNDLYPDVMGNNQKILQVTRTLLACTGMQFAYDFRGEGAPDKVKTARESTIRQWFAWWYRYANDTHQAGIDDVEDLDAPRKSGDGK